VAWLTKAANEGYPSYPRFSSDRSLASLKGYRTFDELLGKLERAWRGWQGRF
jgi:hypothetical protein